MTEEPDVNIGVRKRNSPGVNNRVLSFEADKDATVLFSTAKEFRWDREWTVKLQFRKSDTEDITNSRNSFYCAISYLTVR